MAGLLAVLVLASAQGARLGELARRDTGDIFTLIGECGVAQCAEHGAGVEADAAADRCACACPQRAPLFREDRELCVDDLLECSLATFGTGVGVQRIPFVYLPLKGQIIHPSREITFENVKTPICAVSGAQFLTRKGFLDLRNTLDADVPFNLFRDEGRTFLQWSGEDEVRTRMAGRVMVVRLLCRDVSAAPSSPLDLRGVFTPCVAFRVQGSPLRYSTNVTEVQFAPNAHTADPSVTSGLTVTEYVAVGISSLLLGLVYVASVFLYLHIRRRKKAASEQSSISNKRLKGLKKKDGTAITERDIIRINNERVPTLPNSMGQDDGIIKSNPLLNMSRQFHENKNSFPSDSGSNVSDSEDFPDGNTRSEDNNMISNPTTSAVVHLHREFKMKKDEMSHRDESGIERLPDEHVSIVETTDDREIARPVGTTRRKLYFNPAYFDPDLMAEPPAAALEFLVKIREVISIAKHKMAQKRFQPILNEIPEEETYPSTRNSMELYQGLGSQRSGSAVSLKRENSRKTSINCVGCPGCKSDSSDAQNFMKYDVPACSNCMGNKGDKQNSIRQWLENIPSGKQQLFYNDFLPNANQNGLINSLQSLPIPISRCKLKKQNSFSATNAFYSVDDFPKHRRASTMSVRSEPPLRNYNIPLPEFQNLDFTTNNYSSYIQTVSKANDIRPIGLSDYRTGSLRCNAMANHRRHKLITHKSALPDMVNEAIALEHCSKSYIHSSSDEERFNNKVLNIANDKHSRNSSESPSAVDYETDSLERNTINKKTDTPSADYTDDALSSQASPSLSNALPLEEELTMRNAVYKHCSSNSNTPSPHRDIFVDQNQYEITKRSKINTQNTAVNNNSQGTDYSLVSEVYVNNNFGSTPSSPSRSECSMGRRKQINTLNKSDEKPGCLTIEVKDPPENYIKIHESDDFEPDTLDRKHSKRKELENVQFSRKDLLRNIGNSESNTKAPKQCILLRSSGTFTKTNKIEYSPKFNSVRHDIEHRNTFERPKLSSAVFNTTKSDEATDDTLDDATDWQTEEGRILTLELRHSKRQRQSTPPTIKQIKNILPRPDVLPPLPPTGECAIYEQPVIPPRRVESEKLSIESHAKNVIDRSLSPRNLFTEPNARRNSNPRELHPGPSCSPTRASVESHSLEYQNFNSSSSQTTTRTSGNFCRNSSRRPSDKSHCGSEINTNTYVKGAKSDGLPKLRFRRKKGMSVEDSGYLSSDSTSSRHMPRKIVVAKIVSCSESDDTENEARSESGAESVETHSVYFGSFRKHQTGNNNSYINNIKSARDDLAK